LGVYPLDYGNVPPKMLNDTKIRGLKAKDKPYKVGDSNGLFIYVTPTGSKRWRQKYRINGREKLLTHGEYPFVTLLEARELRDKARELISKGKDPSTEKKTKQANKKNTFEFVARDWHNTMTPSWSANHVKKVIVSLESDIFQDIGNTPLEEITAPQIVASLKRIEKRGSHEQANRVAQRVNAVFRYALAGGLITHNPAQSIKDTLKKPDKKNYNSIDPKELPDFLEALAAYDGHPIVKLATEFLMLTFVRTGELRGAKWPEFDIKNKLWEIPAERMKVKKTKNGEPMPHLVPLSDRAVEILETLKTYTGGRKYVFASPTKPRDPISSNTILQALKRMGYGGKMTGHGFRHLASTTLHEQGFDSDVIERQLAHLDRSVRGVYNKAEYIEKRRSLMKHWSDLVTRGYV